MCTTPGFKTGVVTYPDSFYNNRRALNNAQVAVLALVGTKMDASEDISVDRLFNVYSHLQNVMKNHLLIDKVLSNLSEGEAHPEDFQSIEEFSKAIIDACNQIETVVEGKKCHQCCCQT